MSHHHQAIDRNAAVAKAELRALSRMYQDEIAGKANFYIRSEAQKRRYRMAQKITQEKK